MDRIKQETLKDVQFQRLTMRILKCDWEKHRKDPDVVKAVNELQFTNEFVCESDVIWYGLPNRTELYCRLKASKELTLFL